MWKRAYRQCAERLGLRILPSSSRNDVWGLIVVPNLDIPRPPSPPAELELNPL